jgi:predicted chitinase/lysophospholipase L1-like esterase
MSKEIEQLIQASSIRDVLDPSLEYARQLNLTPQMAAVVLGTVASVAASIDLATHSSSVQAQEYTPPSVVIVGDSITVGREQAGLETTLSQSGLDVLSINGLGSRQTIFAPCDVNVTSVACTDYPDGLRTIEALAPQIGQASAVVLSLGTNDSVAEYQDEILRVARKAHELGVAPDAKPPLIVIPEIFGNSSSVNADKKNEIITTIVSILQAEGVYAVKAPYADFVNTSVRSSGGISRDEVHLTGDGYRKLVVHDAATIAPLVQTHQQTIINPAPAVPETEPALHSPVIPVEPVVASQGFALDFSRPAKQQITGSAAEQPKPSEFLAGSYALDFSLQKKATHVNIPVTTEEIAQLPPAPLMAFDFTVRKKQLDTATAPATPQPETVSVSSLLNMTESVDVSTMAKPVLPAKPIVEAVSLEVVEVTGNTLGQYGITFDSNGKAYQPLHSFFDTNQVTSPVMKQGFRDFRDLPQTGPYLHPNTDWETPAGKETRFVSPAWGIVHRYDDPHPGQKKGVGNSVVIEFGTDPRTGKPLAVQATHFSEIFVEDGAIVSPGQLIALAGDTGITTGTHFSVGMTNVSLKPYTSLDESLYIGDYLHFQYDCAPSALDDPQEICGISPGGDVQLVPVPEAIINYLGGLTVAPVLHEQPELAQDVTTVEEESFVLDLGVSKRDIAQVQTQNRPVVAVKVNDLFIEESVELELDDRENNAEADDDTERDTNQTKTSVVTITEVLDITSTINDMSNEDDEEILFEELEEEILLEETADSVSNSDGALVNELDSQDEAIIDESEPLPEDVVLPAPELPIPLQDKFTDDVVQYVLPNAPRQNITAFTPLILEALSERGIADPVMACYVFATIQPETSGFAPIDEHGKGEGKEYGVVDPQTGKIYHGRGFVQLTWRGNYEKAGAELGIDLVNNPELALEPRTAARIMAWYMTSEGREERIRSALAQGDMKAARQVVNGRAAHGLDSFSSAYQRCAQSIGI